MFLTVVNPLVTSMIDRRIVSVQRGDSINLPDRARGLPNTTGLLLKRAFWRCPIGQHRVLRLYRAGRKR